MPPRSDPRVVRTPFRRRAAPVADVRITALDPTLLPGAGIELRGPPPGTLAVLLDAGLTWLFDLTSAEDEPPPAMTDMAYRALWYELARRTYPNADYHAYVTATLTHAVGLLAGGGSPRPRERNGPPTP